MEKLNGFFAYPSIPIEIGQCISSAIAQINKTKETVYVAPWTQIDIFGHFISDEIFHKINTSDFLIADITELNLNVTYEIGYAIGKRKRVLLTKNKSIKSLNTKIEEIGIYDTLGYKEYQNSQELVDFILSVEKNNPLDTHSFLNLKAPVYLLCTPFKTDFSDRIISRIKKSGYIFRNFDPREQPRLSAFEAITQVSQSYGIIVPLLSPTSEGNEIHNLRAAFIAGLANGMDKNVYLVQQGNSPIPIDYRDFVQIVYQLNELNEIIGEFASNVTRAINDNSEDKILPERSFLKKLNLGASSAENEMKDLNSYYLETDQYLKALRGEAHLVVGRKGSGKSAIFLQVRDREREKNRSKNIVLDLKPDGYKLIKFKEKMLVFLEEGTYLHIVTAFWEYVLLLEICYKIIEKDKNRHLNDHSLYEGYRKLVKLYTVEEYDSEGDFSERMSGLMEKIYTAYEKFGFEKNKTSLNTSQVTNIIYKHDVKSIREQLLSYLDNKDTLWLLFDNIDNGWTTIGIDQGDILIIRALIDATRKIERTFRKKELDVKSIVFLRNDVYDLLVSNTSDRGKEGSVLLDWTDPDLLRQLIRLRIIANGLDSKTDFKTAWLKIFESHYKGEETSQYLIDRSLMRPRFLLNLIIHCKSYAINLNRDIIGASDIEKGMVAYSSDLLKDIGFELRDVAKESNDILYAFIGSKSELKESEIIKLLETANLKEELVLKIYNLLLWYGFLGIKIKNEEPKYIYNFNYNKSLMDGVKKKEKDNIMIVINHAFWPALMIQE